MEFALLSYGEENLSLTGDFLATCVFLASMFSRITKILNVRFPTF